jgi:ATP-binding cassette subfamily B (MDR/TAP) protein 1
LTVQLGISENLGTLLEAITTIIAATIVAFIKNAILTLVTSALIVFILLVIGTMLPFIAKGMISVSIAEMKSTSIASEAFSGIRMIAACGAEEHIMKRFAVWADAAKKHGQKTAPLLALQYGLIFFSLFSCFALSFWYGIKLYSEGRIDNAGSVLVVIMSVTLMIVSVQKVATPMIAVSKSMVAACEFFTLIDAPQPHDGDLKDPDVSATEDIVFSDVDFAYPSRPQVKVLDGLNLNIEAGKITAIVGPSGSGKSTIVGLIERWYSLHEQQIVPKVVPSTKTKKPAKKGKDKGNEINDKVEISITDSENTPSAIELKGSISTCGHPLNDIELKWWRSQIGLVQQEPFLFNDTIYNNVAHGLVGSHSENMSNERKRELVIEACKESFADEFIDRLPDGYDTLVGDSGVKLSGGQRQRISIARAVIKKPKILILDEATSAIDVRGEQIVQAALDKVAQGRTTIVIAHRLSTVKKADKIVVLQKGRVVEQGTHESLLGNNTGAYYNLVHAQHLFLGEHTKATGSDESTEDLPVVLTTETNAVPEGESQVAQQDGSKYHIQGLVKSFGRLLYEQRSLFLVHYAIIVALSMATGAASPLQSWLLAQIIVVFQDATDLSKLKADGNFWSLMWFVLAICTGVAYFFLAFMSTNLAYSISVIYRKQYLGGLLYQKMAFFDAADNSLGTLTARVSKDPKQLEELLGMNMAMVYNS